MRDLRPLIVTAIATLFLLAAARPFADEPQPLDDLRGSTPAVAAVELAISRNLNEAMVAALRRDIADDARVVADRTRVANALKRRLAARDPMPAPYAERALQASL